MDRGKYVMSVRNLILSIIDQSKELKSLELELSKTNNLGKRNSLIKSKVFKLKKLKHTMSTIDRIVNGNIITIRYSLDEQVFQRKFVNISKRDVILLLKLTNSNHKIKILEIKEEFTKESLIKL
jgi:transcriptional regulator of heat shock response